MPLVGARIFCDLVDYSIDLTPALVTSFASPFAEVPALNQVTVPDLWQQQAVAALRQGQDVVVQAPTGSGKTLIFELWSNQGKNRGQAIYTVPSLALARCK
jgi:superfamily II RNA helicase